MKPSAALCAVLGLFLLMACGSGESPISELQPGTTAQVVLPSAATTAPPVSSTVVTPSTTAPVRTTTSLTATEAEFVTWARDAGARSLGTDAILTFGRNTCEVADQGTSVLYSFWLVLLNRESAEVRSQILAVMGAAGIKLCPDKLMTIQPAIQRLVGN